MKIANHDEYARQYLADLRVAREFLEQHLPPEIKAKCNFDKIRVMPNSYVESHLKSHASDIVYQVEFKSGKSCVYVYHLIEHQSTAIEDMPYRVLRYQIAIIGQHKLEFPNDKKLPLVVPIILYNGTRPYNYSTKLADLFADKELYKKIGLGNVKLVDLTVTKDEDIMQHGKLLGLLEITLKHI